MRRASAQCGRVGQSIQGKSFRWPLLGLLFWRPIFKSNYCTSFEDRAPTIFKWVAETWQGTRIVAPAKAARWHAPLTHWSLRDLHVILKLQFSILLYVHRADTGLAPSQWQTALLCNDVFHWLGASPYDKALRWIPWDLTDDKSTLVQVIAWCHQATSHYLSQCWPNVAIWHH